MPIRRIFWEGTTGRDVHVLRGDNTADLRHQALRFVSDTGATLFADEYVAQFADVTLTFTPLFKGVVQGNLFVGDQNGLIVDRRSGVVSVAAAVPTNVKRNFIIEVEARNAGAPPDQTLRETIRVQIHGSVTQAWLTPDQLTIRPIEGPNEAITFAHRFTVRAQFDDGVVGDITDGHGVTWIDPSGHVDGVTGRLSLLAADVAGTTFPVAATLPARLGGATTPAGPLVRIEDAFRRQATPPLLTLVAGGGATRTASLEDSLNVLFLSDGFRSQDGPAFDRLVDTYVHYLKTNRLTRPLDVLTGAMNFWKLSVPSDRLAISVRSEVATIGIHPFATIIPAAKRPPADPAGDPVQWALPHLLYAVGLPVPGDDSAARTPAVLRSEWRALLATDPKDNIKRDDVVHEWKRLGKRTFIDEVDGFPGLSVGLPPAASNTETTFLQLHANRVGSTMMRLVCNTLGSANVTLADGRPLGMLWREEGTATSATTNAAGYAIGATQITLAPAGTGNIRSGDTVTFAGDSNRYVVTLGAPDVSVGDTIDLAPPGLRQAIPNAATAVALAPFRFRDRDFIVILSPLPSGRPGNTPTNAGRYVSIGVGKRKEVPVLAVAGRNAFRLDLAVPSSIEADMTRTLAHELGHSMGLGDEYIEFAAPFVDTGRRAFANLQREADAQIQDPTDPTRRVLHGDEIQWNWHRISTATVVSGEITAGPGLDEFSIPVLHDLSRRVKVGDTLRLRLRVWGQPLRKVGPFEVSGDLVVLATPSPNLIAVRAVHAISAQAFPAGSLLYAPKIAPRSVLSPLYPFAEMVAKNIKDAITRNRRALIDTPGSNERPQIPFVDNEDGRTPVADFRMDFDKMPRVVGLYPGGGTFISGIFHPTGQCMMRNSQDSQAEFCAVCRYVMVDLVAPELHPTVDADYDSAYPQK